MLRVKNRDNAPNGKDGCRCPTANLLCVDAVPSWAIFDILRNDGAHDLHQASSYWWYIL